MVYNGSIIMHHDGDEHSSEVAGPISLDDGIIQRPDIVHVQACLSLLQNIAT